ncbi:two-component system response regulator [Shewanella sp. KX20019]|uniref:response regulator n=1 Tax=Shewanella sp. KX20019 TaxID=2803864 RepID=UPI0019269563|nr:two-component system response regulator [Shewanella sp. KX20019]QQX80707.1 two-component system response regulator [Shewanella sp. KX20019]
MSEENRSIILTVDDTVTNIEVVKGVLFDDYLVQAALSGEVALKIINKRKPDLILLDVMMPGMDGYEVCKRLKADEATRDIPIIFLTAKSQEEDEAKGLALGAVDYITKPISPSILKVRVRNHLLLKASRELLEKQNEVLEERVLQRTIQLNELQDVTMVAMGALAESRDADTGNHIRRTQRYVKILAEELATTDKYKAYLQPDIITALFKSAPLHDIGKVGVADRILLKPGKLTAAEFEEMKLHTTYGRDAISAAEGSINIADNFLIFAKEIAYYHHEKWDGSGYPEGLVGEQTPVSARLMAIADVYDALISKRIYKDAFSHQNAVDIINEGRGSHFDPLMVDSFVKVVDKFYQIAETYKDTN